MTAHEQAAYLTTAELAQRWKISANTIRNWRFRGTGPRYFKPAGTNGKALYAIIDIVEWERSHTVGGEPE